MSVKLARKLFTTTEYHQMIAAGVFDEDDRLELIEGEIVEMSPIGPRHVASVNRLTEVLGEHIRGLAILSVQNPIQLSDFSEPQPDLTLLKRRSDFYALALPTVADVLVAIEVADTTVEKDRGAKIPSYARAGVAESWLVDLFNNRIEIYSRPASGVYQEIRVVLRGQPVVSTAIPQLQLTADDILG